MPDKRMAVVGIGNLLLGDEGIGVHVVESLRKKKELAGVTLIDAGTAFIDVIYDLDGYDKVVIVDAVTGGEVPGAIYRIDLDEMLSENFKKNRSISLHDYGLVEGLSFGRMTGISIGKVVLIGIEPENINTFTGLSPVLRKRLRMIERVIIDELGLKTL